MIMKMTEMLKQAVVLHRGVSHSLEHPAHREFWVFQKGQSLTCATVDIEVNPYSGSDSGMTSTATPEVVYNLGYTVNCTTGIRWYPTSGRFVEFIRNVGKHHGQYNSWHDAYDWVMKEYT